MAHREIPESPAKPRLCIASIAITATAILASIWAASSHGLLLSLVLGVGIYAAGMGVLLAVLARVARNEGDER